MSILQIVIGFILGFFATLIAPTVREKYWPKIVNWLNKEAEISGKWSWYDGKSEPVGIMDIKQKGANVTGVIIRNKSMNGLPTDRIFEFKGELHGQTLIINFKEKADPKNIRGSINLRLLSNRSTLYGKSMYFDSHKNEVLIRDFIFSTNDTLPREALEKLDTD